MRAQHTVVQRHPSYRDVEVRCADCRRVYAARLTLLEYDAFYKRLQPPQLSLRRLTPAQRDVLQTGICRECWERILPAED